MIDVVLRIEQMPSGEITVLIGTQRIEGSEPTEKERRTAGHLNMVINHSISALMGEQPLSTVIANTADPEFNKALVEAEKLRYSQKKPS